MFVLIVGGGKVGLNTARSSCTWVTRSSSSSSADALRPPRRGARGRSLLFGDGTEIWVLEKAGIARADMVVAVTGDDEDNVIISQIAKLKFGVPKVVARVNNPCNQPTFDLLGVDATVCATTACSTSSCTSCRCTSSCPCSRCKRERGARRARGERQLAVRQPLRAGHRAARGRAAGGHPARRRGPPGARVHRDPARRPRALPAAAAARRRSSSRSSCRRRSPRGADDSELDTSEG